MIPFRIVGSVPLFSPYYDKTEGTFLYPLNPAAIPTDNGVYFLVRWIKSGETFDPTKKIGVYLSDWDFKDVEYKGDLRIPEIKDEKLASVIEDIRAGIPDKHGVVECGFNMLYSRDNGENYPVPAKAVLSPPYEELEDLVIYKNQIGKNVLPSEKGIVFRLDEFPPIFRHINEGEENEFHDEVVDPRPHCAYDKIGFTGLPLTLSDDSKLFILHGFETSGGIYRYSMVPAVWRSGSWKISPEPMVTPKDFRKTLKEMTNDSNESLEFGELKPEKEVIYSDAVIPKNNKKVEAEERFNVDNIEKLYMPINLGDMAVFLMKINIEDLLYFCKPLI